MGTAVFPLMDGDAEGHAAKDNRVLATLEAAPHIKECSSSPPPPRLRPPLPMWNSTRTICQCSACREMASFAELADTVLEVMYPNDTPCVRCRGG